jgi:hypothetical protein
MAKYQLNVSIVVGGSGPSEHLLVANDNEPIQTSVNRLYRRRDRDTGHKTPCPDQLSKIAPTQSPLYPQKKVSVSRASSIASLLGSFDLRDRFAIRITSTESPAQRAIARGEVKSVRIPSQHSHT